MQNDEKKVATIADLSDSVYDSFKENTQLLKKIKLIKSYKHLIRQKPHWNYGEIEIKMDELYADGEQYYLRFLRAFCSAEGNGRPSAHVFECLYRVDDFNAFNYDEFIQSHYIGLMGVFDDFFDSKNAIKISDHNFGYGEILPKEFYEAVGH